MSQINLSFRAERGEVEEPRVLFVQREVLRFARMTRLIDEASYALALAAMELIDSAVFK